MLFDPHCYLGLIEREQSNLEMHGVEGPPHANHAKRANPPHPFSTNSTFSTDRALSPDAAALLALLRDRGPLSYGAAATALGWGATRAWRAEAELRAAGRIEHDRIGRAAIPSPENDL